MLGKFTSRWGSCDGGKKPNHNLFSGLPQSISALLFATAKRVHLDAGQVLFVAGDPGDGCYRIDNGLLKVSIVSASGVEPILSILGPGAIVGELAVLDGRPRSTRRLFWGNLRGTSPRIGVGGDTAGSFASMSNLLE